MIKRNMNINFLQYIQKRLSEIYQWIKTWNWRRL